LIHVPTVGKAKTEPASWVDFDTAQYINRIVIESIRCATAYIRCRSHFSDWLEVLVDREVKADSGEELIGPIQ
jgi:hypothetical protein